MNLDFDLYWQKIRNGDVGALEKVYKTSFRPLVRYADEITGHQQQSEEVVQDVLLKIWENRLEISVKESFKSYLFKSVHNHALNIVRHQMARKETVNILSSEEALQFISDNYENNDYLIEKIFSDETGEIIKQAIDELPEQCRRIFRLSRFDSLSNEEIAAKLGLSENTVKTHIYRALQKITAALEKNI
ncbi:MAG TPA: RNA polymerase sigma-70 factor [Bacteroidales bacterium]|nr:RNA polymerase sigma-70 factor [Bacteroidales bacterium]